MKLTPGEQQNILTLLRDRFVKNMKRHKGVDWTVLEKKLNASPKKMWSLNEMESTGGEPDVVAFDKSTGEYIFFDCSAETPKGRRSYCYDSDALESRKEHKPKNSVVNAAGEMGIELLNEDQYRELQKFAPVDTKTSSWLLTPVDIRSLGGAIFGDYRYGKVFIYHNGAESYYGSRGFRGVLRV